MRLLEGKGSALSAKTQIGFDFAGAGSKSKIGFGVFAGTIDLSSPSVRQLAAWTGTQIDCRAPALAR